MSHIKGWQDNSRADQQTHEYPPWVPHRTLQQIVVALAPFKNRQPVEVRSLEPIWQWAIEREEAAAFGTFSTLRCDERIGNFGGL